MAGMLSAALLADLIGSIYDCALDPEHWPETLARLRGELGFAQATLTVQAMPTGDVLLNMASGIPDPWLERIQGYAADIIELWGGISTIAAAPLEQPLLLTEVNPAIRDGSSRNRYYVEWRRPQGIIDTMTLGLARDTSTLATASFVRHDTQGPIGTAEREAARLIAPHLRRAVTISRLLDIQAVTAATFQTVLELLTTPVLLVDATSRLIHANAAGHALLDRRRPLARRGERVVASDAGAAVALAIAIDQASADEGAIGRKGLGIPVHGVDGAAAIHVLPLGHTAARRGLASDAVAAIFVSSVATQLADADAVLAGLFGLTDAEARVCARITRGDTVTEAGAALGIGVSTVRTHLLRIFQKTGVRRQAELVHLAAALRSPGGPAR